MMPTRLSPQKNIRVSRTVLLGAAIFVIFTLIGFGGAYGLANLQTSASKLDATSAYATLCSAATLKASNLVAIWQLFGTPTATPTHEPRSTYGAIPPATGTFRAQQDETKVAVLGATLTPSPSPTSFAMILGDPARGKRVFNGTAQCYVCHDVRSEARMAGPSLLHIAQIGAMRVPDMSLDDYLREAIVDPDIYVVQGYGPGMMPRNYAKTLSGREIDDLVAYMMTIGQ